MLRTRVIPALLLKDESLIKTVKFDKFDYIGDPCNTVRIFNELEVDELIFLDINATKENREPDYQLLTDIANECFMPLTYGGGVANFEQAKTIFEIGFEKIAINYACLTTPELLVELTQHFGSQSIIGSIDVKKSAFGQQQVVFKNGKIKGEHSPVEWAKYLESKGVGEILLTSIDREGSWSGYDIDLVKQVSDAVSIPVIAHGGAGNLEHVSQVVEQGNASAVALGSMVVYQKQGMGVLVNFPEHNLLEEVLN